MANWNSFGETSFNGDFDALLEAAWSGQGRITEQGIYQCRLSGIRMVNAKAGAVGLAIDFLTLAGQLTSLTLWLQSPKGAGATRTCLELAKEKAGKMGWTLEDLKRATRLELPPYLTRIYTLRVVETEFDGRTRFEADICEGYRDDDEALSPKPKPSDNVEGQPGDIVF